MATLAFGLVGTAIGASIGGSISILGATITSASIGGLIGSSIGSYVDSLIISSLVPATRNQGPRLQEISVMQSTEGAVIGRLHGSLRVGGNLIWSSRFKEVKTTDTERVGGKGGGQKVINTSYVYSVSFAVAFCEGNSRTQLNRLWADGKEIDVSTINYTFYPGTETQLPDSVIQAVEGADNTPGFRGTCYIVFEEFELENYGNRIPQITAEITKPLDTNDRNHIINAAQSFCITPGYGEFIYGVDVYTLQNASNTILSNFFSNNQFNNKLGDTISLPIRSNETVSASTLNKHTQYDETDFVRSMSELRLYQPSLNAVIIKVNWFVNTLDINQASVKPYVEYKNRHGVITPREWNVAGLVRSDPEVPEISHDSNGNPLYGGTPSDDVIVEAIQWLRARGYRVILQCDLSTHIIEGNTLPNPYSDDAAMIGQPVFPSSDKLTVSPALGYSNSVDKTVEANTQITNFFDGPNGCAVMYTHYANLCSRAGGVNGFLIGHGLKELTKVRDERENFPAVTRLNSLLSSIKGILGNTTQISYVADWTQYGAYYPDDGSGDVYFPLDEIWGNSDVDFIAIASYFPLSDWRDGSNHLDYDIANGVVSAHDLEYLKANIEGGEHYDWNYIDPDDRDNQVRTPVVDPTYAISGKIIDRSHPPSTFAAYSMAIRQQNIAFSCRVRLPNNLADGLLFEGGAIVYGCWMGLRDGGSTFRLRAGDGTTKTVSTSNTPVLDIDTSTMPMDGELHTITWDIQISPGRIRLWIDGEFIGSETTVGSSNINTDYWAGSNEFSYLVASSNATVGEPRVPWPNTSDASNLYVYQETLIDDSGPVYEDWVFRKKDIRNWWRYQHFNRPLGIRSSTPTVFTPQSKPIWFTEFGCPAIDKGTNQPDIFYDPRSSESDLPYYSNGQQDEHISRIYAETMLEYWRANSPTNMINTLNMFLQNWDVRPFPDYPSRQDAWPDTQSWYYGHWMNGRIGLPTLTQLIESFCREAGITNYDVRRLLGINGFIRGYYIDNIDSIRDILSPLMLSFQFDVFESEGELKFVLKKATNTVILNQGDLVSSEQDVTGFNISRTQDSELPKQLVIDFIDAGNDYKVSSLDARRHTTTNMEVSTINLPISLSPDYVRGLADSLLHQAWIAREKGNLKLPPSFFRLDPGDGITFPLDSLVGQGRIQSIDTGEFRDISFQSFDLDLYELPIYPQQVRTNVITRVSGLSELYILDIPLFHGTEPSQWSPRLAATASPWPGTVAVFRDTNPNDGVTDWIFSRNLNFENTMGILVFDVPASKPYRWLRNQTITVNLFDGTLSSIADDIQVLNGGNVCAMQNDAGHWEIFQYKTATLDSGGHYILSDLIRGKLGTEWVIDETAFSAGNAFVLLENQFSMDPVTAPYLPLSDGGRNIQQHLRFGNASKPVEDDEAYLETRFTHEAMARKPYAPVHLKAKWSDNLIQPIITLTWIRRTRFNGDPWELSRVPLSEDFEQYEIEILNGSTVVREVTGLTQTNYVYNNQQQVTDFGSAQLTSIKFRVYQISALIGRGLVAERTVNR